MLSTLKAVLIGVTVIAFDAAMIAGALLAFATRNGIVVWNS